jgi:hypothetical protein
MKPSIIFLIVLISLIIRFFFIESVFSFIVSCLGSIQQSQMEQLIRYFFINEFSLVNLGFIRRISIIMLFIYLNKGNEINNCYFNLYLIGTLLYIFTMGNNIFAYRISLIFDIFIIPLFSNIRINANLRNIFLLSVFIILLFLVYFSTISAEDYVVPYKTYIKI